MKKLLYFIILSASLTQSMIADSGIVQFFKATAESAKNGVINAYYTPSNNDPRLIGLTAVGTIAACCGIVGLIKNLNGVVNGPQEPNPSFLKSVSHLLRNVLSVPASAIATVGGITLIMFNKQILRELGKLIA